MKYEHIFDVCFVVHSNLANFRNISKEALVDALRQRANDIEQEEGTEAFGYIETIEHVEEKSNEYYIKQNVKKAKSFIESYFNDDDCDLTSLDTALCELEQALNMLKGEK